MATFTVDGTYKDGRIELDHQPADIRYSPVRVTFLASPPSGTAPESEAARDSAEVAGSREEILARVVRRMEEGVDLGGAPYEPRKELDERLQRGG